MNVQRKIKRGGRKDFIMLVEGQLRLLDMAKDITLAIVEEDPKTPTATSTNAILTEVYETLVKLSKIGV